MQTAYWVALAGVAASASLMLVEYRRRSAEVDRFFDGGRKKVDWIWPVLMFVSMILGILSRYYWDLLGRGKSFRETSLMELLRPLLIAPLVFYPIWGYASQSPKDLKAALIAFQNGFFWQAVFETARPIQ